jgi:molecular chaperone DnaK
MPQIEVTFDIDANGIVNVSARDKQTAKEQSIRIQAAGGLSDADIKKMTEEAERFKDEDRKKRELVEVKNSAEQMVHQTEKQLSENVSNPKVAAVKGDVEKAIAAVKEAVGTDDVEKIKASSQALMQVALKIGEAVYAGQQGGEGGPDGDTGSSGGAKASGQSGDNVVDADFEEVKDDKKK